MELLEIHITLTLQKTFPMRRFAPQTYFKHFPLTVHILTSTDSLAFSVVNPYSLSCYLDAFEEKFLKKSGYLFVETCIVDLNADSCTISRKRLCTGQMLYISI